MQINRIKAFYSLIFNKYYFLERKLQIVLLIYT